MKSWREATDLGYDEPRREINPATGKPVMSFDDFLNIQTSLGKFGGTQLDAGRYVFNSPQERDQAIRDAIRWYPELGYEFEDRDGKYEILLTGE